MFDLQYEITAEDYLEADLSWFFQPWFQWGIVRGVPAGLILYCLNSVLFYEQLFDPGSEYYLLFNLAFFGVIAIIFARVMRPQALSKIRRKIINRATAQDPSRIGKRQTVVDETGLYLDKVDHFDRKRLLWQDICRLRETENLFIFDFKHKRQCTFIPKRALDSEQHITDFRQTIQAFI
ncbi:YcxB family protein [Acaryochloris sp. IP29b_bin.137]|uniref:YcxB family protein n=1 Tax=Acaryochloris sp. IP29b_bin.137 TaxID=2969217 RepID=UPI00261BB6AF|nr:YcxB family protein [Acaryochloris sp. IP29b_bin.137]